MGQRSKIEKRKKERKGKERKSHTGHPRYSHPHSSLLVPLEPLLKKTSGTAISALHKGGGGRMPLPFSPLLYPRTHNTHMYTPHIRTSSLLPNNMSLAHSLLRPLATRRGAHATYNTTPTDYKRGSAHPSLKALPPPFLPSLLSHIRACWQQRGRH